MEPIDWLSLAPFPQRGGSAPRPLAPHTPFRDRSHLYSCNGDACSESNSSRSHLVVGRFFVCCLAKNIEKMKAVVGDHWFGWFVWDLKTLRLPLFQGILQVQFGALIDLPRWFSVRKSVFICTLPNFKSYKNWLSILRTSSPQARWCFLLVSFLNKHSGLVHFCVSRYYQTAWLLWVWWRKKWRTCRTRRPGRQLVKPKAGRVTWCPGGPIQDASLPSTVTGGGGTS